MQKLFLKIPQTLQNFTQTLLSSINCEADFVRYEVCARTEKNAKSSILGFFQQKVTIKFYKNSEKLHFESLLPILGKQFFLLLDFYFEKNWLQVYVPTCRSTNIGQAWIHWILPAEGPKKDCIRKYFFQWGFFKPR